MSSYQNNTVTVSHNISSPEAGDLDASSAINARSSNFSLYNVDVENTYGQGAQVSPVSIRITTMWNGLLTSVCVSRRWL